MAVKRFKESSILVDKRYQSMLAGNEAYDPGAMFLIQRVTATGGPTTITFSSIPQTYKHLQIRYTARANSGAGILGAVGMTFNGVGGTSYASHRLWGNGTDPVAAGASSQASIQNLTIAGGAVASNVYGVGIIDIHDYSSTTRNKSTQCLIGMEQNSGDTSAQILMLSGLFNSTSPITQIDLTLAAGFDSNTTYALYGLAG